MAKKRKHIGLKTKLAAALRELFRIPHEHAKEMSEDQMLSLVQWDHNILHGIEVNNEHHNLTPIYIREHREKSRRDTTTVAKSRRVEARWKEFLPFLTSQKPKRMPSRWPSRGFAKRKK